MKKRLLAFYRFSNSWPGVILWGMLIIFFIAQNFVIPSGSMKNTLLIGDFLLAKKFSFGVPTPHLPWLEIPLIPGTDGHLFDGAKPKRGEIVIFRPPHMQKTHFIKRCVATPGDEIIYIDKHLLLHPKEGNDYVRHTYPSHQTLELDNKLWVMDPYLDKHAGIHYAPGRLSSFEIMLRSHDIAMKRHYYASLESPVYYDTASGLPFNAFYLHVEASHYFMMGDNREHSSDSRFWGSVPYGLIEGTPWMIYISIEMRSFEELLGDDLLAQGSDHEELYNQCKELIPPEACTNNLYDPTCTQALSSSACKAAWNRHRFTVRWDRLGKTATELELPDALNYATSKDR